MPTIAEKMEKLEGEVGALMTEQVIKHAEESKRRRLEEIKRRKKEGAEYDTYIARQSVKLP